MRRLIHVDHRLAGPWCTPAGAALERDIAQRHAEEVHQRLHGKQFGKLLSGMYGNQPDTFHPRLAD